MQQESVGEVTSPEHLIGELDLTTGASLYSLYDLKWRIPSAG
jgi:hypothetical protein